jgi:uncharacterized protein YggE
MELSLECHFVAGLLLFSLSGGSIMKKVSVALAVSLMSLAGIAVAQSDGVTMSTDPAKAADVEARAQALQDSQAKAESMKMSAPAHKMHHHAKKAAAASSAE